MKINNPADSTVSAQWKNVRAFYNYSGSLEKPLLVISLSLNVSAYQPPDDLPDLPTADVPVWRQSAIDDGQRFCDIISQLYLNDDKTGEPAIPVPVVTIFLKNTLLKSEKITFSPEDDRTIRDFALHCLVYVTNRAGGRDAGLPPVCQLTVSVSPDDISAADLIKLSIAISFESHKTADTEDETASTDLILIGTSEDKSEDKSEDTSEPVGEFRIEELIILPENTGDFVEDFERLFSYADWRLKIGKAIPEPELPDERQTPVLWAIRTGKNAAGDFHYGIQDQARFYAPRPISKTLDTAVIPISSYVSGKSLSAEKIPLTFSGIDQNIWAGTVLAAIDTFLSIPTAGIDSHLSGESGDRDYISKMLGHKKIIADALAAMLMPIFDSGADDEISLAAACEIFASALPDRLSDAYATAGVAVLDVTDVSGSALHHADKNLPVRFCGKLQRASPLSTAEENSSIAEIPADDYLPEEGKIQYFTSAADQPGGWRLSFPFSSPNAGEKNSISLPVAFSPTHLEIYNLSEPKIPNGKPPLRIEFVNPPDATPISEDIPKFPVILRELPAMPNLMVQKAGQFADLTAGETAGLNLSELAVWNYSLTYSYSGRAQDIVRLWISLDGQNDLQAKYPGFTGNEVHFLFSPLAQFITVYSDVLNDYQTSLDKIGNLNKETETDEETKPDVANALAALDVFERITGAVADGFSSWANMSTEILQHGGKSGTDFCFDIVLESGEDGKARIDVISNSISEAVQPVSPVIIIEPYIQTAATDKPEYACASYNYIMPQVSQQDDTEALKYLSYEGALNNSQRTVVLEGCNIFSSQSAFGEIQIFRNESVAETDKRAVISDSFKFTSASAKPSGAVAPSIRVAEFDLESLSASRLKLKDYLNNFFDSLPNGNNESGFWIKTEVYFSYDLTPSMPDSPRAKLPIVMVPPTEVIAKTSVQIIDPLIDTITKWTESGDLQTSADSEYNFRIEIFSEKFDPQITQNPLLVIDNLFIKTEKIDFS